MAHCKRQNGFCRGKPRYIQHPARKHKCSTHDDNHAAIWAGKIPKVTKGFAKASLGVFSNLRISKARMMKIMQPTRLARNTEVSKGFAAASLHALSTLRTSHRCTKHDDTMQPAGLA